MAEAMLYSVWRGLDILSEDKRSGSQLSIVDFTSIGIVLGDEQWVQLLQNHLRRARVEMSGKDCHEIKIIGDSFMVAFRTALEALDFALAFETAQVIRVCESESEFTLALSE